ncbi:MAG: DNA polymerase III subunit delta [Ignavibacteria bacterium]|jgi:DNA polymerase-3 subunit delta|nr:DNA polymerase III subunit delta [Ignavibacteria bacterium]
MPAFNIHSIKTASDVPPVLLLYGADTFTMDETLDSILATLIVTDNDKTDYDVLDGEDIDQFQLVNLAAQYPMLSDRRVVVVRRFDKIFKERRKKSDTASPLAKYLATSNPTTTLLLLVDCSESKLDTTKFPYDIITKNYKVVEFTMPYEDKLPAWVVQRFKKYGKTIDIDTASMIVAQTTPSLYSLASEVEKIMLYDPSIDNINLDYVLSIIGTTRQNTVFELTKAVASRDVAKAISILLNILKVSSQEVLILVLLRDLFIKMWHLLELSANGFSRDEMAKRIGLRNAYFLNDYLVGLKKYTAAEINNALLLLCETDEAIKSTNTSTKMIVEEKLFQIMG